MSHLPHLLLWWGTYSYNIHLYIRCFFQADTAGSSPSPDAPNTTTTSAQIERWSSDPLCLGPAETSCPNPNPKGGGGGGGVSSGSSSSRGDRLAARGAAQDKANVICQIAAVEALLKGSLPCGVKVVVGATPPPGSLCGNAPMEVADRLADFFRAHPSVTGLPELVVVRVGLGRVGGCGVGMWFVVLKMFFTFPVLCCIARCGVVWVWCGCGAVWCGAV